MPILSQLGNDVFSPVNVDGSPRSVINQSVQRWATEIERYLDALGAGSVDPGDLPPGWLKATNTGAGTPNAIEATTPLPVSAAALIVLNIVVTNTGSPVTVRFNGAGTAYRIRTRSGEDVAVGGLTPGIVFGFIDGSDFWLANDESIAALIYEARDEAETARDEAETAQAAAEAARDIAAGYASDAVSQGNVPIYATAVGLAALNVPDGINFIRTNGYYTANGVGAATYRLMAAPEAVEPGEQLSNGGAKRWGLAHRVASGRKQVDVLAYGIREGDDVTSVAQALYTGLSNARVIWPAGAFDLTDFIPVYGHFIETAGAGRKATTFRQHTWGRPVFATADPNDPAVRPVGARFYDFGAQAWNGDVKCYFYDAFFVPGFSGPYTCAADVSTASDQIYLFRNGVLEAPASISGIGGPEVTLTLSTPQGTNDYMLIKVTNKDDLRDATSLWIAGTAQAATDSTAIFHGGGDDFVVERLHVEGFVAPVSYYGDWTSNVAGVQSRNARIYDITFDNCDFMVYTEGRDGYVHRIIGGKVAETQTDSGLTVGQAPVYKDPHVLYVTDRSTLAVTENLRVGILEGENRYSSNYKFRNCRGLTVEAGAALSYFRHLDIEGAENSFLHFPALGGAFNGHLDGQRSAFNLYGCRGVTIAVDRLYLTSDITFVARFRKGYEVGGTGNQVVCSQCVITIRDLYINASALRTNEWIINHAGVDCWVIVENLYILGQMGGHFFRGREEEGATPVLTMQRGGLRIKNVYCSNTIDLKLALLDGQNGGDDPNGVTVDVDLDAVAGGNMITTTFDLRGTNHRTLYRRSGAQLIPFSIRNSGATIVMYSNVQTFSVAAIAAGHYRVTHNLGHINYAVACTVERATSASVFCYVDDETATTFDVYVSNGSALLDGTVRCVMAAKAFGL